MPTTQSIYLDYNATTPLDPQVLEKMLPYLQSQFGNAASASHQWGWAAESALKKARQQVASLLNAKEHEIIFTAGATESNNLAIFGLIHQLRGENPQQPIHMLASAVEHSSVKNVLNYAQSFYGVEVEYIPVNPQGFAAVADFAKRIRPETRLISLIWVQNEIGTIQPLRDIAKLAKQNKIYLHSDATQAVGKISVNLQEIGIDLLSCSAHKFYGPKGVGALYLRSQNPKVQIRPQILGGGQENNLRSGTSNISGIVGMGEAAEICFNTLSAEQKKMTFLRNLLWKLLQEKIPGIQLNGPEIGFNTNDLRSPINLNISFQGRSLDKIIAYLPTLALSTGSACHSGTWSVSPILKAIGLSDTEAQSTLRLSLGRWTTELEIRTAADSLQKAFTNQ